MWPHAIVGDLDSAPTALVDEAVERSIAVTRHPADKNDTDLALALDDAVVAGASVITVVAAFGGRLDHELATIGLLAAGRWSHVAMSATDGRRSMWIVHDQVDLSLPIGQTVSLVPWAGDVTGVRTKGMQWPLQGEPLESGSTRGVSNVTSDPAQSVSVTGGVLLVVVDRKPEASLERAQVG